MPNFFKLKKKKKEKEEKHKTAFNVPKFMRPKNKHFEGNEKFLYGK